MKYFLEVLLLGLAGSCVIVLIIPSTYCSEFLRLRVAFSRDIFDFSQIDQLILMITNIVINLINKNRSSSPASHCYFYYYNYCYCCCCSFCYRYFIFVVVTVAIIFSDSVIVRYSKQYISHVKRIVS